MDTHRPQADLSVKAIHSMSLPLLAECDACGHSARLSAAMLARRHGDWSLREVGERSRCRFCNSKGRALVRALFPAGFSGTTQ